MADKNTAKQKLLPELRFPEFRNDWELVPLGEHADVLKQRAGKKKYLVMSIETGVGLISQLEKFGRDISGNSYKNYTVIQKDDFAYNKSATKPFPEGFIAKHNQDQKAAVPNSIFTCFRLTSGAIESEYLYFQLLNNLHGKWLRKFITVGARANGALSVNTDDLMNLPVPVPSGESSKTEQQKIADCLGSLDDLIAAHSRKLAALQDHKKGLLQQLFPAEGETTPKLRFPEFEGEWKETKLGILCESISSGKDHREADGSVDLYGSTGVIGKTTSASFSGPRILVARVGANAGLLTKAEGQYGVTDNTLIVSLNPDMKLDYFLYYLGNININKLIFGSGQPLITGSILKNLQVLFPVDDEQQKISACFASIDELILAQKAILEDLTTHKRGLMQQLFPSQHEVNK